MVKIKVTNISMTKVDTQNIKMKTIILISMLLTINIANAKSVWGDCNVAATLAEASMKLRQSNVDLDAAMESIPAVVAECKRISAALKSGGVS